MKIHDCFLFFNELDLLELRLQETFDHVDRFVILESDRTFTGQPKDFNLAANWDRFKPYADKIKYIKCRELSVGLTPFENEARSREFLKRGLHGYDPDDLVIISDVDEIFRPSTLIEMRERNQVSYGFRMANFAFKINYLAQTWWQGGAATRMSKIVQMEHLRHRRFNIGPGEGGIFMHAGWHFSWLGDESAIKLKLASFSHQELNIPEVVDNLDIKKMIENKKGLEPESFEYKDIVKHELVAVDEYYPDTIKNNMIKWLPHIAPGGVKSARQLMSAQPAFLRLPATQ